MLIASSFSTAGAFILGALALTAIQVLRELFVDRQRWKREDALIDKRNKREDDQLERSIQREDGAYDRVRRAARWLLADELDTAKRDLELMLRKGVWPVAEFMERGGFLGSDEWIRNRDRLAEALEDENSWLLLTAFYYSLGRLRARALSATAGVSLAAAERKSLETMRDQATALYAVLWGHIPLPDNWQEQLAATREAGDL